MLFIRSGIGLRCLLMYGLIHGARIRASALTDGGSARRGLGDGIGGDSVLSTTTTATFPRASMPARSNMHRRNLAHPMRPPTMSAGVDVLALFLRRGVPGCAGGEGQCAGVS